MKLFRVAPQYGAIRVERKVGVGALIVVHRIGLERRYRLRRPLHSARVVRARDLIGIAEEAMSEVHGADVCAGRQIARCPFVVRAIDGGDHAPDLRIAAAEILRHRRDAVIRPRLEGRVAWALEALRYRVEHADGRTGRQATGQLRGAEDGRGRLRYGVPVGGGELRSPADAPAIV